jgi:hypothetical protein
MDEFNMHLNSTICISSQIHYSKLQENDHGLPVNNNPVSAVYYRALTIWSLRRASNLKT